MPIDHAAQQFEQTVKKCLTEATNKTGHPFTRVYTMIEDSGAVEAAKRLSAQPIQGRFKMACRC